MGRGVVHPVDMMGNKPWSADLLDHLANHLSENGHDLKKLMAHIATSAAYQSAAVPRSDEDAGDGYVFKGPELKRLTAEQFVDTVWMMTGAGPARPLAPAAIPAFADPVPMERRLTRATLVHCDDLMRSLGRPNREQVVTVRPEHLSTLQALDLLNGKTLAGTLAAGGANILKARPATSEALAKGLFESGLGRSPTPVELEQARAVLGDKPTADGVADLLGVIVMLPEFQLVR